MSNLIKNTFLKSIGSYTLVNIINKGIPFLLIPLLTHYLSKEDMGILTNIESLITISVTLIGVNLSSSVTRQYVKKGVDIKSYISTAFRIVLLSFVIVTLLYGGLANFISELTEIPKEIIYVISIYAILDNLMEVILALWRMRDKAFSYGSYRIARTIIELGISLLLVVGYSYNWYGRFYGLYVACVVSGLFAAFYLMKNKFLTANYKKGYAEHFLKFGIPLIPHSISGVLIMYSDKIIITQYLDIGQNGVYSVAFTIGMAISLLQNSFNQAWVPMLFKKLALNSRTEKIKLVKITYLYMIVMLLLALVLWGITPIIYSFLGEDFSGGMGVVAIIGFGFAFNGMYKMMVNYMFYAEKTFVISLITIFLAALNIGLSIYLIKDYGIVGTAYASAITFFAQFIITWYISNKVYPMPWFKLK